MSPSRVEWWAGQTGLPAMTEAIALAADRDGRRAVEQPIEERRGERGVGEDLVPLPEALVARQDDRLLHLVAFVHELEETGRVVPLEGLVSDFAPMGDRERRDLLEIIEDRTGQRATLITSQVPIEHWHDLIGDASSGTRSSTASCIMPIASC